MREGSSQSAARVRVERGVYRRTTKAGATRYEVAYLDATGRQRWRTVAKLQEARKLRAVGSSCPRTSATVTTSSRP